MIIRKIKICGGNKHRLDYIGSYLINMNGTVCSFSCSTILSRLEGKKYTEIAEIQHISVKTVEYRISQALKILKTRLSEYLTL